VVAPKRLNHVSRPVKKSARRWFEQPLAAAPVQPAVPVAASSAGSAPVPAPFYAVALSLALLALGLSLIPLQLVPIGVAARLERNRPTLAVAGLAIVAACAVAGLLTALSGR
jgi:hypothetical protein